MAKGFPPLRLWLLWLAFLAVLCPSVQGRVKAPKTDGSAKQRSRDGLDSMSDEEKGEFLYDEAVEFLYSKEESDRPQGLQRMKEAADLGNGDATTYLANAYLFGESYPGISYDITLAHSYIQRLEAQGDPEGIGLMGFLWATGLAGFRDERKALQHYQAAAEQEDLFSQAALAYRYEYGVGVEKNCQKAADYMISVAAQAVGNLQSSGYFVAERPRLLDDYLRGGLPGVGEGVQDMYEFAEYTAGWGDVTSQVQLGEQHYFGTRGTPVDRARAFEYFNRAAEGGSATAKAYLGEMYSFGDGVAQDNKTALKYYLEAAHQEDPVAMSGLGRLYLHGLEGAVKKDYALARQWFERAGEKKNADGLLYLGIMYYDGLGMSRDYALAYKFYLEAANMGNANAQYNLGTMYLQGTGTPYHCEDGVAYMRMSADQSHFNEHQSEAYQAYGNGQINQSLALYLYAAEMGQEAAQSNVAYIVETHVNETHVPHTETREYALRYWIRSAEQGSVASLNKAGDYHYYGWGMSEPDFIAAQRYYKRAAKLHSGQAWFNLGYMAQRGLGETQDPAYARACYQNAWDTSHDARLPVLVATGMLYLEEAFASIGGLSVPDVSRWVEGFFTSESNGLILMWTLLLVIMHQWRARLVAQQQQPEQPQ
eukprot:comp12004_c0_seq1/m.6691 comp12004_c0_seq1/g.6691  ORF comp12004_c0_seq1/g.6691 comp12004_c0_seq1/m.6691 type:complete len:651 (-) comp12004_c0_seq1:15-1967(-)